MTHGTPNPPVVIGYDGSPASMTAADWAADEAARRGAPLRLVHALALPVVRSPMGISVLLRIDPLRDAAERLLDDRVREVRVSHPDLPVDVGVDVGDAAGVLLREARQAALLVVGTRGLGELRSLMAGSVAAAVTAHAECPVVVVPAAWPPASGAPARIVVGVDGSEVSARAVDFAFAQASRIGAELVPVLASIGPVSTGPGDMLPLVYDLDDVEADDRRALAEELAGHSERYPDVTVVPRVVRGHPATVLVEAAKDARLLVVGSRGRGGFAGLLLGSVSRAVVHHAPCPVAVVR